MKLLLFLLSCGPAVVHCDGSKSHASCDPLVDGDPFSLHPFGVVAPSTLRTSMLLTITKTKAGVVLGPHIGKTGHTALLLMARDSPAQGIAPKIKGVRGKEWSAEHIGTDATVVRLVRDPFDRFLSGYRQIELFFTGGWMTPTFAQHLPKRKRRNPRHAREQTNFTGRAPASCARGEWFRDYCLIADYAAGPSPPFELSLPESLQLRRLERFVEEVERCGYFDWHIMPMALTLNAMANVVPAPSLRKPAVLVDLATAEGRAKVEELFDLPEGTANPPRKAMSTSAGNFTTAATKRGILALAEAGDARALNVAQRICRLVRADYACFPDFTLPRVCESGYEPPQRQQEQQQEDVDHAPRGPESVVSAAAEVSDPLRRLLAAYATIEEGFLLGVFDRRFASLGVTYWQRNCHWMPSRHRGREQAVNDGDQPGPSLLEKWRRLNAFLADVERVGFFDPTLRPQSHPSDAFAEAAAEGACDAVLTERCTQLKPVGGVSANPAEGRGCRLCLRGLFRTRGQADVEGPPRWRSPVAEACTDAHLSGFCARTSEDWATNSSWRSLEADSLLESASGVARLVMARVCSLYAADYSRRPKRDRDACNSLLLAPPEDDPKF